MKVGSVYLNRYNLLFRQLDERLAAIDEKLAVLQAHMIAVSGDDVAVDGFGTQIECMNWWGLTIDWNSNNQIRFVTFCRTQERTEDVSYYSRDGGVYLFMFQGAE